jgi:predicted enzyme related to lactoylglutathione lyase
MNVNRRQALGALGAAVLARALNAAEARPSFHAVDHFGITCSDSKKAAGFYAQLFGATVYKEKMNERRYVKIGPCYVSLAPPGANQAANYRVDHVCPGVEPFDIPALERYLNSVDIKFRHTDDFGPFIPDPDNPGIQIQWWTWNSWPPTIKTSAPEPPNMSGPPIFSAVGMDHVLLQVNDPEKSAAFYEKLFGAVAERTENRTWFQAGASRVGLSKAASGERPGVNHVCVLAAAFDRAEAVRKLEQAGAKIDAMESASSIEFRDPDGVRLQVMYR